MYSCCDKFLVTQCLSSDCNESCLPPLSYRKGCNGNFYVNWNVGEKIACATCILGGLVSAFVAATVALFGVYVFFTMDTTAVFAFWVHSFSLILIRA